MEAHLWRMASTSDLLLPGNTLINTSTGLLCTDEYDGWIWEGNWANCWW